MNHRAQLAENCLDHIRELHTPVSVYEKCISLNSASCPFEHFEHYDMTVCSANLIGYACQHCCFAHGYSIQCREHHGDHTGVDAAQACKTNAVLHLYDPTRLTMHKEATAV